jgi:hypothetical protein
MAIEAISKLSRSYLKIIGAVLCQKIAPEAKPKKISQAVLRPWWVTWSLAGLPGRGFVVRLSHPSSGF